MTCLIGVAKRADYLVLSVLRMNLGLELNQKKALRVFSCGIRRSTESSLVLPISSVLLESPRR